MSSLYLLLVTAPLEERFIQCHLTIETQSEAIPPSHTNNQIHKNCWRNGYKMSQIRKLELFFNDLIAFSNHQSSKQESLILDQD